MGFQAVHDVRELGDEVLEPGSGTPEPDVLVLELDTNALEPDVAVPESNRAWELHCLERVLQLPYCSDGSGDGDCDCAALLSHS